MPTKRVLIAPLDWGLGHATRSIPVIRSLMEAGCIPVIAAEGLQAALLRKEFPEAVFVALPGYRMTYARSGRAFGWKMLQQLPKMRRAIQQEHRWLQQLAAQMPLDGIVSDNRFGLHHPSIPSVILTHQLHIRSPFPGRPEKWLQQVNYRYLQNFDACWIVDYAGTDNLAGKLSHPDQMPSLPVHYLGPLSRFAPPVPQPIRYDLLALISGPEPQRTAFEQLLSRQLTRLPLRAMIVCGRPDQPKTEKLSATVTRVHHLDTMRLQEALQQSALVVARSGYSTVMDLVQLEKKGILVPTPGQSEQAYLGARLMDKGYFMSMPQAGFELAQALAQARHFSFRRPELPAQPAYEQVIRNFVANL